MQNTFKIGTRVAFTHVIDRYPFFSVAALTPGTVEICDEGLLAVKMDGDIPGLNDPESIDDWDGCVILSASNGECAEVVGIDADLGVVLIKIAETPSKKEQPILTAKKLIEQMQAIIAEHGPHDFAEHEELREGAPEGDYTVVFEAPGDDGQTVGQAYLHEAVYAPAYHELPHIILKANEDVRCE